MKELKDLQVSLQQAIKLKPEQAALYLRSLPLKEDLNFTKAKRLAVYQNGYIIRMSESLKEDFPKTLKHIKKEKDFIYEYLKKYPSKYKSLASVSEHFPKFIKEKIKDKKYLSDLAELEWLECLASYTVATKPVDFNQLKFKTPEDIFSYKFKISPTLYLMSSNWTIHKTKIKRATTYLAIFRNKDGLQIEPITLQEYNIFELLKKGHTILSILRKKQKISQKSISKTFEFLSRNQLLS